MGASLPIPREEASVAVADNRIDFRPVEIVADIRKWFPELSKKLSRDKPPATIHYIVGGDKFAKLRTVYDWCAGKFDPPAMAIVKLLHSPAGWTVLEYLMRDCKQPWWLETKRALRVARAYDGEDKQFQTDMGF